MKRPFLKAPGFVLVMALLASFLIPLPALACKCQTASSACNEVAMSNLVFIGTVESMQPIFLSRWALTNRTSISLLNNAYADALEHPSAIALTRLKEAYQKVLAGSGVNEQTSLDAAKTIPELVSLFNEAVDGGMRARFRVKTLFRQEDDDDDVPNAEDFFNISTPFGDCGYDFQVGETYLVYANNDEGSGSWSTGSCTRTRRMSEAGEDLAYLFFYKNQPEQSTRLEGFVTTDASNQLDFDNLHDPETIKSPVPGTVIELRSDSLLAPLTRFAQSDRNGRFVFDGLPEGEYRVTAFAAGYPFSSLLLAGPQALHLEKQSCARRFIVVPKTAPKAADSQ
jgi:hypothetical protein